MLQNFSDMDWQPHPILTGVATRFAALALPGHPVVDTLVAQVAPGGILLRHSHPETCEIAYVLSASGQMREGEPGDELVRALTEGCALFIPAGVPHQIENTSAEVMFIFAVHTRKVESNA
ncbi:MAG: cupin domain-containing protein [Anaerolineae bacterium]|nr:cupin domain-containing protein [Anaerolineae bacterium]NUQ04557.1 cupin domain-containing protein [Anaerolineae bacterium]